MYICLIVFLIAFILGLIIWAIHYMYATNGNLNPILKNNNVTVIDKNAKSKKDKKVDLKEDKKAGYDYKVFAYVTMICSFLFDIVGILNIINDAYEGLILLFVSILLDVCSIWGFITYRDIQEEKEQEIKWLQKREEDYNNEKKEALKTPEERYTMNFNTIRLVMGLAKGLAMNDVRTGIEMQSTDAPGEDWAIAGGLASGMAGGFAGIGAAVDTINRNTEKTIQQHNRGQRLVEQGLTNYKQLENDEKAILSENYDGFIYSAINPELVNKLGVQVFSTKSYGVGYITANVKITAKRRYTFPGTNKAAVIDGSVRVDLYDKSGVQLIATGYYCPPGRCGNDKTKTGFGLEESKIITLKMEPDVSYIKNYNYKAKLSNPNLWLLQL